jgi:hypothetical protein
MYIGNAWYSEAYLSQVAEQFNDPEVRERVAQMEAYLKRQESQAKRNAKRKEEKATKTPKKVDVTPKSRFDRLDED